MGKLQAKYGGGFQGGGYKRRKRLWSSGYDHMDKMKQGENNLSPTCMGGQLVSTDCKGDTGSGHEGSELIGHTEFHLISKKMKKFMCTCPLIYSKLFIKVAFSNMVATGKMWLFKFKLIKIKLN